MNLRPPVKIDALMDEWSEDTVIDSTNVDLELLKIGHLHSKYLNIMSYHRHVVRKTEADYKDMKEIRREYIEGKSDKETLEQYGWEQFQGNPISMRTAQESKLEHDPVLTKILLKKVAHEEIVSFCESVLRSLNNRSWDLKSYVDYQKWANPAGR